MRNSFGVIIISHGRAQYLKDAGTAAALKKSRYSGRTVVVIDDEDDQGWLYKQYFTDVYVFNKEHIRDELALDMMNNFNQKVCSTYARNVAWKAAEKYGFEYFAVCDDDIPWFGIRFEKDGKLRNRRIPSIDLVFDFLCDWIKGTDAMSIGFFGDGWLIGGAGSASWKNGIKRFIANCYICRTEVPFQMRGGINEDLVASLDYGARGGLMFSPRTVSMAMQETQKESGGMTEEYAENGTYQKAFYLIMMNPSAAKICAMGQTSYRIHHRIDRDAAFPKIINEKWKK